MSTTMQTPLYKMHPFYNRLDCELFEMLPSDAASFVYSKWACGNIDHFIEVGYSAWQNTHIPDGDYNCMMGRYCLMEIKESEQVHYYAIGLALDNGIVKPLDAIPGKVHGGAATYRVDENALRNNAGDNLALQAWNPGLAEWIDTNSKLIYVSESSIEGMYSSIEHCNYFYIEEDAYDEALDEAGNHPNYFANRSFKCIGTKYKLDIKPVPIEEKHPGYWVELESKSEDDDEKSSTLDKVHPNHFVFITVNEIDTGVSYKFLFRRDLDYVLGDRISWTLMEKPSRDVKIGPLFDVNEKLTATQKDILFQYAIEFAPSENDYASLMLVVHPSGEIKITEI